MEKRQEESLVWLDWAKELQFIAQAGLTYSKDPFDLERFQRIREISAEIVSRQTGLSFERVTDLLWRDRIPDSQTRYEGCYFSRRKNPVGRGEGRYVVVARRVGRCEPNRQNQYRERGARRSWARSRGCPSACFARSQSP